MDIHVIDTGPADGPSNMERDRKIIAQVTEDSSRAVLHWYRWQPPCFSLGYGQRPERIFDSAMLQNGEIRWVKRPTGGALVYHEGDLSYSFTLPRRNPWGICSPSDLYAFVSRAWILGLESLGIPAGVPETVPSKRSLPSELRNLCLASYSQGDLSVLGKKIGGAAQRRLREVWQQQGFFLLQPGGSPKGIWSPSAYREANRLSSDLETCGYPVSDEKLRDALTAVLKKHCGALS